MSQKRLAIITTHPIQYNAPLFKLLSERNNISIKVFYTWGEKAMEQVFDPGFGKDRKWDIPLLDGYDFEFITNISTSPGSDHFRGIVNPDLINAIKIYKADAILIYGWSFQSHLRVIRYFKKKLPVLFRGDSTLIDEKEGFSFKKLFRRFFLRWVYSYIDTALYVGLNNRRYYNKHGITDEQLVFAPHAVDNSFFQDPNLTYESEAAIWRKELGIGNCGITFLYAGKFEPKKNPFLLLKAFMSIEKECCRLILVGNGILENEMKAYAKKDSRIIFLDFQNQKKMPVVYRLGNVFILPSKGPGETWGLAINEAMASGKPVIASDKCGGAVDLIDDKNGFVFKSDDLESLSSVLNKFTVMQGEELAEMGSESKRKIENFNLGIVAASIESMVSKQQ